MKIVRYVVVAVSLLLVTLIVIAVGWREVMQWRVNRETAITTPNGIESLEKVTLGGVEQWLLIRGWDRSNPVLLHLHGGPGSADISIARFFDAELIQHFTVVHWDQRGAGKSFSPDIPPESMTRGQFVEDIRELEEIGPPPYDGVAELLVQRGWLERFGGVSRSKETEMRALIRRALSSPDYSLLDAVKFFRGQSFSSGHMYEESRVTNLFQQAPRIEVPVYFFAGRHDYNCPSEEAERYYRALDAPRGKHFIWFESAAHMIPYEASDEYAAALIHRVLAATRGRREHDRWAPR